MTLTRCVNPNKSFFFRAMDAHLDSDAKAKASFELSSRLLHLHNCLAVHSIDSMNRNYELRMRKINFRLTQALKVRASFRKTSKYFSYFADHLTIQGIWFSASRSVDRAFLSNEIIVILVVRLSHLEPLHRKVRINKKFKTCFCQFHLDRKHFYLRKQLTRHLRWKFRCFACFLFTLATRRNFSQPQMDHVELIAFTWRTKCVYRLIVSSRKMFFII